MRDEEYGWQEVRRRRNDRRSNHAILPDVAMAFKSRREDNAKYKTYFFSNFPENHGAQAMLNIFRKYGKVVKVVIPAKRDKGGRRFGFARGETSNAEEIIMETANILNLDENSNIRPVIFNEDYREDFQERVGLDRQSDADPTGLDTTADRGKGGLDNNNQVRKGLGRNFKSNGAFKDNNEGNVNTKGDVISFINRPKHGGPTRDQSTNRSMSGNFLDNTNSSEGNSDSSRTISNPLTQKMETGRPIQRSFQPPLAKKQLKDVVTKEACNRNLLGRHKAVNNKSDSTSSAGSIIGCSSLKSIEIKNCNKQHQNRNEEEVTNKVWKGVVSLGVEGDDIDSIYKRRITVNERKDIEAKNMREHKKQVKS
ncbi:unnamed protein product [Trifolium pratense]|uniref:Uncharacterized protein n=1 Tax=Trifolium pratense TaxID=57577 RepID=A0ACB0L0X4_TRIPR|nr:unnamed protein product [Trifolium pratense]